MTGAGKTHTMLGDIYRTSTCEPGICSMAIDEMFATLNRTTEAAPKLKMSYLEIYNEQVKDLLVTKPTRNSTLGLMILEDPVLGVTVPELSEHEVHNSAELLSLVLKGNEVRTMAATKGNQFSSRSHAILQISVQSISEKHGVNEMVAAKLSLVDLAGSEKAGDPKGIRMVEGGKINKSLLALGNCINILSDKNKPGSFVPYRDSKLTRLLKDSLGGNTKTVMIACISQMTCHYDETINTLKYAERAKKITKKIAKNVKEVEINVDQYKEIIKDLRTEIATLKEKLLAQPEKPVPIYVAPQTATTEEIEVIDAEITRTKEIKEKYYEEFLKTKGEDAHTLDFYNSVCTEDDAYLNKLSHDLLTKYEEHYEMKESVQELLELNAKNEKLLEACNKELDELVRRKVQESGYDLEQEIERKAAEIDSLRKTIENNDAMRNELERSLAENSVMQQRYLALVIKMQSQKKRDVLELQIAVKALRTEKVDLALQNLELKRQQKVTQISQSEAYRELVQMRAELAAAKESLKQKDMIIQSSKAQIATQTKEIEQLRKIKDMYAEAMQKSSLGDLISPGKECGRNYKEEHNSLSPDDYKPHKTLQECPSFESVSTVKFNANDISGGSAIEDFNLCINAISNETKKDPLKGVELRNATSFPIPEEAPDAEQNSSVIPFQPSKENVPAKRRPEPINRRASVLLPKDKENVKQPLESDSKKRNNSASSNRGYFSSLSENYGKALTSFHNRGSIHEVNSAIINADSRCLKEKNGIPLKSARNGREEIQGKPRGSLTSRYTFSRTENAKELRGCIERMHSRGTVERNKLSKVVPRLNTTGKLQSNESMGNLTREINDLIQRQKENLKIDFEKAKESAMHRGVGIGTERKSMA